ncbi:MAG: CPBP family intramembrane glutamic endopeptidase [Clostridium sp.]|nr:CPBP family intramembrane glutamic endopeptidase [Clostridium sp.]
MVSICIAFIGIFLNTIMLFILSLFGDFTRVSQNIPIASSSSNFIILLLVTALTPAICEEALFRGLMLSCYEQLGIKKAIIASGIFFGIFHFSVNIQGLLGLSFMGIIFAYIVFKTNSLFALPAGILCFILLKLLPASKSTDTRVHIKNRNHIKSNIIKSAPLLPIFLLYIYLCLKTLK